MASPPQSPSHKKLKITTEDADEETPMHIISSETQNRETQNFETQNNETQNRETQNSETQNNETQNRETQNSETQNNETQNSETQNNETQNKETQKLKNTADEEDVIVAAKTQFSDIPEGIILSEILPRLPAKTLVRFKSVSREWNAIISSTQFAETHLTHLSSRSVLTLDYYSNFEALDYEDFNFVFSRFGRNTHFIASDKSKYAPFNWLVDSCNGLALLVPHAYFNSDFSFVVYNPVLGQDPNAFIEIQRPQGFHLRPYQLSYDNHSFGFGYVSSHKDYYIVAIELPRCLTRPEVVAFVYSFKTREWTIKETPRKDQKNRLVLQDHLIKRIGILVNETLHWSVAVETKYKFIVAFDLASQGEFTRMELPYDGFGKGVLFAFSLCCLNDCLCVWGRTDQIEELEMWMMKEYGVQESWTKLFTYRSVSNYCRNFFGLTSSGRVLVFYSRYGHELMLADFSRDPPETLLVPNFVDKVYIVDYVQSLVSPVAVTGREEDG
ncbi:F-box protein CPR30-like [Chenopodium quinoa]|uniref:F-box protein CPR30-like n=1 Tax=Chenopodium quinoa TaxID=63459 RepID=UPI000B76CFEF|nr:F-box protein CPR30-like [Chenopodium quinoa]